jgi:hypothetical protein
MIRHFYGITTILFASSMAFCMEPVPAPEGTQASASVILLQSSPLPMTRIRHWKAVESYFGVVAYTTKSDYIGAKSCYSLPPSDDGIKFGWIADAPVQKWNIDGQQRSGHVMRRLIKAGAVARMCVLTGDQLNDQADVLMREATDGEVVGIRTALLAGEAEFENTSQKDAQKLLDRYQLELNARLQPRTKCLDRCSVQ